jgi:hypothetical protein
MALQNLENAFSDFKTIQDNLNEGIKFHSDLNRVLSALKEQAVDLTTARSLERKDMLKQIADAASQVPPSLPEVVNSAPALPPRTSPTGPSFQQPEQVAAFYPLSQPPINPAHFSQQQGFYPAQPFYPTQPVQYDFQQAPQPAQYNYQQSPQSGVWNPSIPAIDTHDRKIYVYGHVCKIGCLIQQIHRY